MELLDNTDGPIYIIHIPYKKNMYLCIIEALEIPMFHFIMNQQLKL